MVRPLRSKRATIWPVRPAGEGVRLDQDEGPVAQAGSALGAGCSAVEPSARRVGVPSGPSAVEAVAGRLGRRSARAAGVPAGGAAGGGGTAARGGRRRLRHLGLAVRADLPARVERAAARGARLLELAHAARAAQERLLDLEAAVLAREALHLREAGLGGGDLELALVHVVEVLGRADDRVDDGADEREEQRGRRGAGHEHDVVDPPAGVRVGPERERQPERDQDEDEQLHREVEPAVQAEDG